MTYQRDAERRLRVGLVGVGDHAYRNVLPALHHLPVSLVALCDLDDDLLRRTAPEFGNPALFTEPAQMYANAGLDAVLLCVGPRQHPTLAIQAMAAGLHVWLEKPPGLRAADVARMRAAAGDRVCAVGFKKAAMPAVRKAIELIDAPDFGSLRSMVAVYPMTIPADGREVLSSGRVTNWLANGCHPLSLMLSVGGPVRSVQSCLGPGAERAGSVVLRFASGAVGTLVLAGGAPAGRGLERYEFFADGRAITIDDSRSVAYHRGIPFDYSTQTDFTAPGTGGGTVVWETESRLATLENTALYVQGIVGELTDFCDAALSGSALRTGGLDSAFAVMQVYEAALLSEGTETAVDEVSG